MIPRFARDRRAVESDICIIGSGISAAMVADKLARTTSKSIVVVEAGDDYSPMSSRAVARERFLSYGENPGRTITWTVSKS
jgi:quinoprotein glucose dehydrogenase